MFLAPAEAMNSGIGTERSDARRRKPDGRNSGDGRRVTGIDGKGTDGCMDGCILVAQRVSEEV